MTRNLFQNLSRRVPAFGAAIFAAGLAMGASCEKNTPIESKDVTSEKPEVATPDAGSEDPTPAATKTPQDVGPPAPAIFMMTGLKGYTEPCGCTLDIMLGGIDRIVRYFDEAQKLYPSTTVIDGGNLFFETTDLSESEIPQERARVDVIVAGLKRIKPILTIPGDRDFVLGADFYTKKLAEAGVVAHGANLELSGKPLPGSRRVKLGNEDVLFIAVGDPSVYEKIDAVKATDPSAAITRELEKAKDDVSTIVLVAHGELSFVKDLLAKHDALDFGLVGRVDRETDQVDTVESRAYTLEPYDQGRYVGILKLYSDGGKAPFVNARQGSKSELETIEKQIAYVNGQISRIPPSKPGEESPIAKKLRERLDDLRARRVEIKNATIEVPEGKNAFLWRAVPLEPEFAEDPRLREIREAYNQNLKKLNSAVEREVVPVEDGKPFYIGSNQCAMCHAPAMEFWKKTAHGSALATLEERHKDFDQNCIGCHVVGYEKPGGSVLGKLQYSVEHQVSADAPAVTIDKDLRNVGCENCHGPGSAHRFAPVDASGQPQNILKGSGATTCQQCHVPEHSPRFDYEIYVGQITGEGHTLSTK